MDWNVFNNKITTLSLEKGIPLSGAFELTSRCNFKCKMCYVACPANDKKAISSELTAEQWIDMARQARDVGLFYLILTGGEVFLRKDFEKIYEALSEMGFNITIYSNASLITPKRAKWLGKMPPSKVSVTVYGATPETYEKVTGCYEGYIKTMRALDALKSENIRLEIKTTIVEGNYLEYEKLFEIAYTYSNNLGIVNYISPRREGCGSDPMGNRLSPFEIVKHELRITEYGLRIYPKDKSLEIKIDEDTMEEKSMFPKESIIKRLENSAFRCQAGKTGFWLTWDGRMIPCGLLNTPNAKPLETGFVKAWENIKEGCRSVPKCSDCEKCDFRDQCMACPGRLMTETACFTKPAKYLCDIAKYRTALKQEEQLATVKIAT
ncbi:MAG: radical SAM protein [Ruminiclostridium sp.]